ncbi:MAG: diguanylate cyclase [Candidatus Saccharibacteria bacterium]
MLSDKVIEIRNKPLVLIVDDSRMNLKLLSNVLSEENCDINEAMNGKQALEKSTEDPPDLILLDLVMPDMDGFEVCEKLKSSPQTSDIPVILITASNTTESIVRGFETGAVDYVTKPFNDVELRARVRTHLELKRSRDIQNQLIQKLQSVNDQLQIMAITDQLTGLNNRRGFISLVEQQIKLANRSKKPIYLFYIDLDGMKWVNDNLGHEEGDNLLIDTAHLLKSSFRVSDIIARLGGDEFAALAVDSDSDQAEVITSRLLHNIEAFNEQNVRKYKVAMSIGTAKFDPQNPCSLDDLMSLADTLMYENKKARKAARGINC